MLEYVRMGNEVLAEHRGATGEVGEAARRRGPVSPMFTKGVGEMETKVAQCRAGALGQIFHDR